MLRENGRKETGEVEYPVEEALQETGLRQSRDGSWVTGVREGRVASGVTRPGPGRARRLGGQGDPIVDERQRPCVFPGQTT